MDCVIETEPTEYFVEVEFWEEFPLRKFFTTKWSTHINRQFIYKSDAASPHQGTNRESEKISKWIGRQHWFLSLSLSLSSLRVVRLVVKNLMLFISEIRQNYDKHSIQKTDKVMGNKKKANNISLYQALEQHLHILSGKPLQFMMDSDENEVWSNPWVLQGIVLSSL